MPPSLVAEPPMPISMCLIPSLSAWSINSPVPKLLAFIGSSSPGSSIASPEACAISIIAVLPPIMPYSASTLTPLALVTVALRFSPSKARTSASTVPSPPSAIGAEIILQPGSTRLAAPIIVRAANSALMLPLNLSGESRMVKPLPAAWRRFLLISARISSFISPPCSIPSLPNSPKYLNPSTLQRVFV